MKTSSNKKSSRRNDRKVLVAEESTKSWADSDSDSSSSSSSSSDSEQEEVHCFMADHASDDEVFDFANTEFTREDLVQALNDMVHEYKTISHTFEEIKAENASLKNSSAESSSDELEDTDSLKTELSRLKIENDLLRNEASKLKAEQGTVHSSSSRKDLSIEMISGASIKLIQIRSYTQLEKIDSQNKNHSYCLKLRRRDWYYLWKNSTHWQRRFQRECTHMETIFASLKKRNLPYNGAGLTAYYCQEFKKDLLPYLDSSTVERRL
ncbi:hypothetical protein F511_33253 [Dorcoceras hygrometricum]|uniref:Uncharacterized protein n=1 Tax=Dorcoceras hygrometricum TaxID=472368 RepID=A0A2Z7AL00_9LAMI|nr:hypothetical protein F511_33253 [Dorcoceras hygrometricum]